MALTGYVPLQVEFTDTSTPSGEMTTWSWDFGDGDTSSEQNPTHTYDTEGVYTVSLNVASAKGTDQTTDTVTVETAPLPTIAITSPSTGPVGGLSVPVVVNPSDSVYGIKEVNIWWRYCPSGNCGDYNLVATLTEAPWQATWTFPSCGSCPEDRFSIVAQAENNYGVLSALAGADVRLTGRGC